MKFGTLPRGRRFSRPHRLTVVRNSDTQSDWWESSLTYLLETSAFYRFLSVPAEATDQFHSIETPSPVDRFLERIGHDIRDP